MSITYCKALAPTFRSCYIHPSVLAVIIMIYLPTLRNRN